MANISLYSQDYKKSIIFESESNIEYNFGLDRSLLLDFDQTNYYLFSKSKFNPYISKNVTDTIYEFDFKTNKLKSKLVFYHNSLPAVIFDLSAMIYDYKITSDFLLLNAGSLIIILNRNGNNLSFNKIIETKCYVTTFRVINNKTLIAASNYPDNNGNFNILKIDINNGALKETKSVQLAGSYFGYLSGNKISISDHYTSIAIPSDYKIIMIKNQDFSVVDTIVNTVHRKKLPPDFTSMYKSKSDFNKLETFSNQYFNIIKVLMINDNRIMVIKADFNTIEKNYFIDVFEKNSGKWVLCIENKKMQKLNDSPNQIFTNKNAIYPFSSDLPKVLSINNKLYIVRNFLNLNHSIGLSFATILRAYNNKPFSTTKRMGISCYKIE